jgi:hypothetical protein
MIEKIPKLATRLTVVLGPSHMFCVSTEIFRTQGPPYSTLLVYVAKHSRPERAYTISQVSNTVCLLAPGYSQTAIRHPTLAPMDAQQRDTNILQAR